MPIGLIAGNGQFPFLVLRAARTLGHDVAVVAIKGEAFPSSRPWRGELGGTTRRVDCARANSASVSRRSRRWRDARR